MLKERRSHTRFSIDGNIVLKPEDGTSRVIKADLTDFSFLGAGVYASEKIEPGIRVKFELTIKLSKETFIGEGIITYANEIVKNGGKFFKMGIEFINPDRKKIVSFLNLIQYDFIQKTKVVINKKKI